MVKLRILAPDGTTNYITNPSMRYDTSGWTSVGSTISRSLNASRFGVASLKIVTNGSAVNEGAYFRVNALSGISEPITVSVYVRGSGAVRIRLLNNPNGKQWVSDTYPLSSKRWTRISVSGFSTGSNDLRLYVETNKTSAQAVTFYADGAQMERKAYVTTYCDGDQPGCYWAGTWHATTSVRRSDTRAGGRWIELTNNENLYFTTIGGLGTPSIKNNIQPYSDAPGSYFQNFKVSDRVITIMFHAVNKKKIRLPNDPKSLDKLHSLRQTLFEIIKPDKTAGGEDFLMEYQDGAYPIYFRARYDTGLEGDWDIRNEYVQSFSVRFIANAPFFTSDTYDVSSLNIRERQTVNYVAQRYAGAWRTMNGGMNNVIYDFVIGRKGEIFAIGNFTRSNNSTSATDPQIYSNFVAYWDGTQWQKLGSGANNTIRGISIAPNGDVYVTGDFTSIGGVAANRVAYWNGSTWNAMGTGLNASGYAIQVAADGTVYLGGAFTTAGGVNAYYMARWNGSSWGYCGIYGGLNSTVYSIVSSDDGTIVYFGGAFTDEYSSPGNLSLNYVGYYDSSTNQFYDLGDGFNATVLKLALSPSGRLYAGGQFTATGAVSPDTILYIGYYNGTAWFALGVGADNYVRNIDVFKDETVIVSGDFLTIGAVDSPYIAYWNNSTWVSLDIGLQNACYAVRRDQYGNIYASPNGTLADFASITTIENVGTAEANPVIYMKGPCTVKWFENQTSQKRLYIDLDVLNNEEVFIDFSTGEVKSSIRASLSFSVQVASDIRAWTLLPGNNTISVFASTDISAVFQIGYTPRFWSADSTAQLDTW